MTHSPLPVPFPCVPAPSARRTLALLAALCAAASTPAAAQTFTSEASFLAAVPGLSLESFEALPGTLLGTAPVVTPLLSVSVSIPGLGVQTAANAPQVGYGTSASDGTHYVLVYGGAVAPGTLTLTFAQPVTAFGFTTSDIGDTAIPAGALRLTTNAGAYATGVDVLTLASVEPDGATHFFGLSQAQPFSQVQLTFAGFDEAYGIDEVYLATAVVPEPGSWALMAAGLAGLAGWARRSRGPAAHASQHAGAPIRA